MSEIDSLIKSEIDSANIVLFMKGTGFPQCGFSGTSGSNFVAYRRPV